MSVNGRITYNHYADSDESDDESGRKSVISEAAKRPLSRKKRACGVAHRTCIAGHNAYTNSRAWNGRFKSLRLSLLVIIILSATTILQTFRLSKIENESEELSSSENSSSEGGSDDAKGEDAKVLGNEADATLNATNLTEAEELLLLYKKDDPGQNMTNVTDSSTDNGDLMSDARSPVNDEVAAAVRDALQSMFFDNANDPEGYNSKSKAFSSSTSSTSESDQALLRQSILSSMGSTGVTTRANSIEDGYGHDNQIDAPMESNYAAPNSMEYANEMLSGLDGSDKLRDSPMVTNGFSQRQHQPQQQQQQFQNNPGNTYYAEGQDQQLDVLKQMLLQQMTSPEQKEGLNSNMAKGSMQT